jgi:hypothetical protein
MEIYPRLQAQMLLFALALGLAAGLWRQLLLAGRSYGSRPYRGGYHEAI